jgi:nucleoside 2-deoxyribosyltransferase
MDIYLAGTLERNWRERVKDALMLYDVGWLDPTELSDETEFTIARTELQWITDCDLVFIFWNADNPSGFGLSVEFGMALGMSKPIIMVLEEGLSHHHTFFHRNLTEHVPTLDEGIRQLRWFAEYKSDH